MYISDFRRGPVLDWVDWARYPEYGPVPWRYDDSRKTPPWARRGDQAYDLNKRRYVRRLPIGAMDPWNQGHHPWPVPMGWEEQQLLLQQQGMLGGGNGESWVGGGGGGGPWTGAGGGAFAAPHFRDPFSKGIRKEDEHLWHPAGANGNVGRYSPHGYPKPTNIFPGVGRPRTGDLVNARRPRKNMPTSFQGAMNDFRPAIVNGKNRENWVWNPHLMLNGQPSGYAGRYPHHHHDHYGQRRRGRHRHRRRSSTDDYSDDDDFDSDEWSSSDEESLDSVRDTHRPRWYRRRRW